MDLPPLMLNMISPQILQNGYIDHNDAEFLRKQRVTDILNLAADYPDRQQIEDLGITVHHIEVSDQKPWSNTQAIRIVDTIRTVVSDPVRRLYVHCEAGVSRSPTAVWIYFVATGKSEVEASNLCKSNRRGLDVPSRILTQHLDLDELKLVL